MIIRIVRMSFRPDSEKEFVDFFNANKEKIRAFPGCTRVELLKDVRNPGVYSTYSHWDSEEDLENYRHSELFKGVWGRTKTFFTDKPSAHSYEIVE